MKYRSERLEWEIHGMLSPGAGVWLPPITPYRDADSAWVWDVKGIVPGGLGFQVSRVRGKA